MRWFRSLQTIYSYVFRRSGNGGPQTCLPAAHDVALLAGPYDPSSPTRHSRPSRGAKPREADDRKLPQMRPHDAGSRGGGGIKARVPREDPMMQYMTIETRRAPGGRRLAQCPSFPFGAKGASTGVEYRGIRQRLPFQCNKTKTSRAAGWRSTWSPRRRHC